MKYSNIILNVPHSSVEGVSYSGWDLSDSFLLEVKKWTDWYTNFIFSSNLKQVKTQLCKYSRFVVDVERLSNDPLEKIGQGIIYEHFNKHSRVITEELKANLLNYYNNYQDALKRLLGPDSLLIDCHSFPSFLSDVDVCIGFNEDWSKPDKETLDTVISFFKQAGYNVALNEPYSNSISPVCNFHYHSLMIEVNKRCYMDEDTLYPKPEMAKLILLINALYRKLLK